MNNVIDYIFGNLNNCNESIKFLASVNLSQGNAIEHIRRYSILVGCCMAIFAIIQQKINKNMMKKIDILKKEIEELKNKEGE